MSRDRSTIDRLIVTTPAIRTEGIPSAVSVLPDAGSLVAHSPSMRAVLTEAGQVAPLDVTVLITGETGVGKEWMARWLHHASRRAHRKFVAVNCGALADTLLETELFGHVRGAFTGAVQDRLGRFEAADGGTLFLDEIGEVSAAMQVRLLRVIQEREVQRVGENQGRRIDVRLIAATNHDLREAVAEQRFRRDLYYRLLEIELHVPPLRERPEDLPTLARDLLARSAARLHRPIVGFTPNALDRLLDYPWPGNIRELEHAIVRACAVAAGPQVDVEDLPATMREPLSRQASLDGRLLVNRERAYIRAILQRHQGHRRRTAEELGISLSTLKRKLRGSDRSTSGSLHRLPHVTARDHHVRPTSHDIDRSYADE